MTIYITLMFKSVYPPPPSPFVSRGIFYSFPCNVTPVNILTEIVQPPVFCQMSTSYLRWYLLLASSGANTRVSLESFRYIPL